MGVIYFTPIYNILPSESILKQLLTYLSRLHKGLKISASRWQHDF
jgi:hypothetical protein